eukprot:jgi/Astpho2/318/Aster-x0434
MSEQKLAREAPEPSVRAAWLGDAAEQPPQTREQQVVDFRCHERAPKGFKTEFAVKGRGAKRKLEEYREQVEQEAAIMQDIQEVASTSRSKRAKMNVDGLAKASGRIWREPGIRAGSFKSQNMSSEWEKKMQDKAHSKAFKEARNEVVAARKAKLSKARKQREDAKQQREANRLKSAVTSVVTNPKTLKKMMKSKTQRKKLIKGDPGPAT